ncbi:MAG: hypothetical protein COA79_12380 [Planctomycetota bacterium]|nr:MAG: hypothetical protein COA79_12380 [Planctomycetota bacterium]
MISIEDIYRSYNPDSDINDAVKEAVKAATVMLELDFKDTFVQDIFSRVKLDEDLQKFSSNKKKFGVAYLLTLFHLKRISQDEYDRMLAKV